MAVGISRAQMLWLKALIHSFAALPLVNLYYQAYRDALGADPVEAVIHFTGMGALNLLMLSLLIRPLAKQSKMHFLLQCRRMIGLYAFAYGLCHVANFLLFEVQLNMPLFLQEIVKRPYITVGMTAFVLLSALAVTSVNWLRRKMGTHWQRLHNFSYLIALLVVVHFYWSVKSGITEPLLYLFVYVLLMLFRAQKLRRWRHRLPGGDD